jgi:alkylation response protein AidB-like acyl-CoA dehydrogenase
MVDPASCTINQRPHDMGSDRADIVFLSVAPASVGQFRDGADKEAFWIMGAAARACQMAGALETCLDIGANYAQERHAFGRPIGKFQAVQQNLATLAGEVAVSIAASGSAADTLEKEPDNRPAVFLEVASAKIRVGEAARDGIAIAHQVHGGIGFTSEYILQRFTRSLMGWRDDFGEECHWAVKLGNAVAETGAE